MSTNVSNLDRMTDGRFLVFTLAAGMLVAAAPSAVAQLEAPDHVAAATTTVMADGTSGVTLQLPTDATAGLGAIQVDLLDQPAAMVQLVPHECLAPSRGDWCPMAASLAVAESTSGGPSNSIDYVDRNSPNLLGGAVDVYVLSPGPVRITLTLGGLEAGTTEVRTDRTVEGTIAKIPSSCPPQFGDCRTVASGHLVDTVGELGSTFVHAYSRTSPHLGPGGLVPNQAQSKSDLACGFAEALGSSLDPADHDGSCDITPRESGNDEWRQNLVNYGASATPISGPISRFGSFGLNDTGRVYMGFRAHALAANDSLEPGATSAGAWAAWLHAGLG
jgi:hypothetical protein